MAAFALFTEKGFSATRMDEVAALAGVSKGAIYLYFPDKMALLLALLRETVGAHVETVSQTLASHKGPVAPLIPFFLATMAERLATTSLPDMVKLVVSESRAHPEIGHYYIKHVFGRAFPLLQAMIERGIAGGEFRAVDAANTVRCLIGPMLLGAIWTAVFQPLGAPPVNLRALAATHADLFLHALAPKMRP